nr:hypothetical protein [Tanacetum cinerariifolium]
GLDLLRAVAAACPGQPLLVDGNEAWPDVDSLLRFLEQAAAVPGLVVHLLEQPLPAALGDDYRYLRPRTAVPLLADESVTDEADFAEIARQFHGVNVKLMKAGGYQRGIDLLRRTRAHGLLPMLGCMVETSLGIWSALQISALADVHDLDGMLIVRDEPFGLVQEAEGQLALLASVLGGVVRVWPYKDTLRLSSSILRISSCSRSVGVSPIALAQSRYFAGGQLYNAAAHVDFGTVRQPDILAPNGGVQTLWPDLASVQRASHLAGAAPTAGHSGTAHRAHAR